MNALTIISHLMNALIIASTMIDKDAWNSKIATNGPTLGEIIERALQFGRDYEHQQAEKLLEEQHGKG